MTGINWNWFPSKGKITSSLSSRNVWRNTSNSVFTTVERFPEDDNMEKFAALAGETQEYPRNSQLQNSTAPGITEDYIAHVSEDIEGRVTKKLSQEFSRTESHILGALPKLDEFLLNPQIGTFWNFPERWRRKPGTKRGSFPECSPSWNGVLYLSCLQPNWLRPGRDLSQLTAFYRKNAVLTAFKRKNSGVTFRCYTSKLPAKF